LGFIAGYFLKQDKKLLALAHFLPAPFYEKKYRNTRNNSCTTYDIALVIIEGFLFLRS
jgi:uridine kinase